MEPSSRDRTEQLLAHSAWVRGLARHLAGDPERADDLVQDTWVAALLHPPRTPGSVASTRAFLGGILRNAWRQRARGERHRREREETRARPEAVPSGEALVDEVDSQRVLLELVLGLDEPARTTVILRYVRGLSAAEIAREQGVPAATVRSRLMRALDELRARLDARHGGDRDAWVIGFLGWAHAAPSVPAPPVAATSSAPTAPGLGLPLMGALVMKAVNIAVLAAVLALAAFGVARLAQAPREHAVAQDPLLPAGMVPPTELPTPVTLTRADPLAEGRVEETRRAPSESIPEPAPAPLVAPTPTSAGLSRVTVAFVDEAGLAVPGVLFRCARFRGRSEGGGQAAVSGANGLASLELALTGTREFGVFDWRLEGFQLGGVEARLVADGTTDLGMILLQAGTPVSGRVVDGTGRPVAGASVWAAGPDMPDGDPGQITRKGPHTVLRGMFEEDSTPAVRADPEGLFHLPGVPPGGARVWAHAEDTRYEASMPFDVVAGQEVHGIEVVLHPLAPEDRIEGIVLTAEGDPLPRASVQFALHDEGFGMTSSLQAGDDGRFRLVLWRRVPHAFTVQGPAGKGVAHVSRVEPGTLDLVLRLGEQEACELVVRNAEGSPVESYLVETCVGDERSYTSRIDGGEEHPEGRTSLGIPEDDFWIEVRATGYGVGRLGPFAPDQVPPELELFLERAPSLTGHVRGGGVPLAGATVSLYRALGPGQRLEVNGYPALWQRTSESVRTDAEGAFVLMPREDGEFLVRAELDGWAPGESRSISWNGLAGAGPVEVVLGHGGTLVVQVLVPAGKDPGGIIVAVTRGDGHPQTRRAGANGEVVFEGLLPGTWDVRQAKSELDPSQTSSSIHSAGTDEPEPEPPHDVEVLEGRTVRTTLRVEEPGE